MNTYCSLRHGYVHHVHLMLCRTQRMYAVYVRACGMRAGTQAGVWRGGVRSQS
jgi:hypothetical protein